MYEADRVIAREQKFLHTDAFTHRCLYAPLRAAFFYTQSPLLTDVFTHRCLYTQMPSLTRAFTRTLFHTNPFTHRLLNTQALLHTDIAHTTLTGAITLNTRAP